MEDNDRLICRTSRGREEAPARRLFAWRAGARRYFVVPLELPVPLGDVDELDPLGDVDELEPLGDVDELEPLVDGEVVELEPEGVDGEADGLVDGVPPTRSLSVRLQASVIPPMSARAQRPDSNFFIADGPPCGVVFDPGS